MFLNHSIILNQKRFQISGITASLKIKNYFNEDTTI